MTISLKFFMINHGSDIVVEQADKPNRRRSKKAGDSDV